MQATGDRQALQRVDPNLPLFDVQTLEQHIVSNLLSDPDVAAEARRLELLVSYQLLDTPGEAVLDSYTQLASLICQTPIALAYE